MIDGLTPSPFLSAEDPSGPFKAELLAHLRLMELPRTRSHNKQPCNKECHLMERDHMIEIVRQFIREH